MTMEALLPSEIARLVLGYLEEQNCPEVAKMFLIMSPLLQECCSVAQRGGKFTTKVHGITLINLIDKFCAINTLVQEKLSKIESCEQIKTCGDVIEQLRFLMDGSRGQRFVVNINVPSQNSSQASGGSPIISSSMRKRRHSGPVDRERNKRSHKALSLPVDQQSESGVTWSNTVETTPLEQLPGNQECVKDVNAHQTEIQENQRGQCSSTVSGVSGLNNVESTSCTEKSTGTHDLPAEPENSSQTCETGTDTEELMLFTNTEVQTAPFEQFDTESDIPGGPVENLSLLTKELLNRTELQERIAETINRALIPSEMSLRECSFSDSTSGECNTSIMRELDNAIKSIVMETETDPVFEQFLLETIGQGLEGEMSPDEDGDGSVGHSPYPSERQSDVSPSKSSDGSCRDNLVEEEMNPEEPPENAKNVENPPEVTEFSEKDPIAISEKDLTVLDDVNAQAILSIISVSNTSKEQIEEKAPPLGENLPKASFIPEGEVQRISTFDENTEIIIENMISVESDSKLRRKTSVKAKREKKVVTLEKEIPEQAVPIPTLVVCSKQEIESLRLPAPRSKSKYVPILPKDSGIVKHPDPTLYLRTVNVVRSVIPDSKSESMQNPKRNEVINRLPENHTLPEVVVIDQASNTAINESITLYAAGNSNGAIVQADLESIQLEESMNIAETGLSPYLRLHGRPIIQESNGDIEEIHAEDDKLTVPKPGCDMITKRTPRSIMKSRSRNHRLSLSTPRRRSNHIRALDFNTPTKGLNSSRRHSDADKSCGFSPKSSKTLSKACRTSLFKSPQFGGTPSPKRKQKTPVKLCRSKIPIATRSPAPKLIGGWDKIAGVGMIIDGASQSNDATLAEKNSPGKTRTVDEVKRSWDADLRMTVMADVQPVEQRLPKKRERVMTRRNSKINKRTEGPVPSKDESAGVENSVKFNEEISKPIDESINTVPCVTEEAAKKTEIEITGRIKESGVITQIVDEQGKLKKYAKLKTLTTSVTRRGIPQTPVESAEKISELGRINSSKMPDLETPRKFDPNLVPPTPRVLSPSSSMTTPFAQVNEDSGRVQSFVSTPDFPPTPSIIITPKQCNESTADDAKKSEYGSNYYQPSNELTEVRRKVPPDGENAEVRSMHITIEERVSKTMMTNQVFETATEKLEITQFEVIKENLPKEQAIKELKISTSSDPQIEKDKACEAAKAQEVHDKSGKSNLETSGTADDSSDSESDTSSSSSSSSSCCSCCDTTNNSSRMSTSRKFCKTPHKADPSAHDTMQEFPAIDNSSHANTAKLEKERTEDPPKENINCESQELNEMSPMKVIPLAKTEELLKDLDMETPAKDETLLAEADISETPSSSKSGIESLTNLNSKISAIIREDSTKPSSPILIKPKIINVQNIPPNRVRIIKLRDSEDVQDIKSVMDAELARELEEKRRRTLDKLKAKPAIPPPRSRKPREVAKNKSKELGEVKESQELNTEISSEREPVGLKPVRKSVRNAEKQAKRGLSEPRDRLDVKPVEIHRKAQSSRESSANDDEIIENVFVPVTEGVNKKEVMNTEKEHQKTSKLEEAVLTDNGKFVMKTIGDNIDDKREEIKSKVDLVKRDLFSDEENSELPSSRKPRLVTDKPGEVESKQQNGEVTSEIPRVLESLQLVPANKSLGEMDFDASYEHIEISFVYDETARQPKKRRPKISQADLELKVQTEDAAGEPVLTVLSCTAYDEIFNITPAKKKRNITAKPRVVKEKPVPTLISKRKGKVQLKNSKSIVSGIQSQPLATSSPVMKEAAPKIAEKVKATKNTKTEEKGTKPRKRRHSESKEDQTEKKARTTDPIILLSQMDIDNFLNKVYGPES